MRGEQPGGGGTVRYVDSSLERLQVLVRNMTNPRHAVLCNGQRVPLHATGTAGEKFPRNALEAESRRVARFFPFGHSLGKIPAPPLTRSEELPLTLDLRRPLL